MADQQRTAIERVLSRVLTCERVVGDREGPPLPDRDPEAAQSCRFLQRQRDPCAVSREVILRRRASGVVSNFR